MYIVFLVYVSVGWKEKVRAMLDALEDMWFDRTNVSDTEQLSKRRFNQSPFFQGVDEYLFILLTVCASENCKAMSILR